jgi:hypothetical protein
MIDGIANTGTHTFVEKNKIFRIDIHLHVHSHSMRHSSLDCNFLALRYFKFVLLYDLTN